MMGAPRGHGKRSGVRHRFLSRAFGDNSATDPAAGALPVAAHGRSSSRTNRAKSSLPARRAGLRSGVEAAGIEPARDSPGTLTGAPMSRPRRVEADSSGCRSLTSARADRVTEDLESSSGLNDSVAFRVRGSPRGSRPDRHPDDARAPCRHDRRAAENGLGGQRRARPRGAARRTRARRWASPASCSTTPSDRCGAGAPAACAGASARSPSASGSGRSSGSARCGSAPGLAPRHRPSRLDQTRGLARSASRSPLAPRYAAPAGPGSAPGKEGGELREPSELPYLACLATGATRACRVRSGRPEGEGLNRRRHLCDVGSQPQQPEGDEEAEQELERGLRGAGDVVQLVEGALQEKTTSLTAPAAALTVSNIAF